MTPPRETDTDVAADATVGLTLAEKASLTSGADMWRTKAAGDIPALLLTDGPHGLRKQPEAGDHLGLADSVPATCFPPAVALGSSWDVELVERVGRALAAEAVAQDVDVVLAPGINLKRSPLCGRNFEYFAEDPILSAELGAAMVRGIQSRGVGASLKHFACNNQETDRMRISADVDPRPLHELYLRSFRRVVKDAAPWTVMASYNRVNGFPATEDAWLLTRMLREAWGFDGLVVSDWGAVDDRVAALVAGLDLEMPATDGRTDREVIEAVEQGRLDPAVLDASVARIRALAARAAGREQPSGPFDVDAHHALAREAAARSIVLLCNDGTLPLAPAATVAMIGALAAHPRFQGAGSSLVHATRVDVPLDEIRAVAHGEVVYAEGYPLEGDRHAAALRDEAVRAAAAAEVAVLFLGLPTGAESEGYDRVRIDLPGVQLELLDAVVAANPRTVVVLANGGVVELPFRDRVSAIVEGWLLGQAGGGALADVLYGVVSPSGKLAETVPLRLEDTPSFGAFPGELGHVRYAEGLFPGYRGFDERRLEVAFPFGHGLGYTTFAYADPTIDEGDAGDIVVSVRVRNTGRRPGREVVQLYASLPGSAVQRPPRELKAFASVELAPGQARRVRLVVRRDDLAYWDIRVDDWVVEAGDHVFEIGASSRDIRLSVTVPVESEPLRLPLTMQSSIADLLGDSTIGGAVQRMLGAMAASADSAAASMMANEETGEKLLASIPIGRLANFPGIPVTHEQIAALLAAANAVRGT